VTYTATAQGKAILSAKKIRADGTVEELGVIASMSMTDEEMQKIVAYNEAVEKLGPPPDDRPPDVLVAAAELAHADNEAHSHANEAANRANRPTEEAQ